MNYLVIILIAVSLSLDAFSLSLSLGTLVISRKIQMIISLVVGIFHFFMPILGNILGRLFLMKVHVDVDFLESIIFFYIALVMFKDFKNQEEESFSLSILGILIFALGVSLDSFGVGFAMNLDFYRMIESSMIYTVVSFIFTLVGLRLGGQLRSRIGDYTILIGGAIMSIIATINFCQFIL